jgi:hypothetical protein
MKSLLKEIGRKSILWLCLAIGLVAGGVFNLSAKVEQDCVYEYNNPDGKHCWAGGSQCIECRIDWETMEIVMECIYIVDFCSSP